MTYELLYILPSHIAETEIDAACDRVDALLTKHGAKTVKRQNLGRLKLAYPIKNSRHGTYILAYFETETTLVDEVNKRLRLSEDIVRHLIVTPDADALERTFSLQAYVAPLSEEGRALRPDRRTPTSASRPLREPVVASAKEQVATTPLSTEELDRKLDQILGDVSENV